MGRTGRIRFRRSQAIAVAAAVAFVSALPLAAARWYLTPILLVPLLVAVWTGRAGTDADPSGVRIRALLRERPIPWAEIAELAADPRGRAMARLTTGRMVPLPAVRAADLPRLVAASGRPLLEHDPGHAHDPARTEDPGHPHDPGYPEDPAHTDRPARRPAADQ